jgi:putative membrane protein insertion efficiency factor
MSAPSRHARRLKRSLLVCAAVLLLCVADSFRAPKNQVTGWAYIKLVRLYQWGGRPLLKGHVQCRFHPSCSEYSIEAVETHGIRHGLVLTFTRLSSCTHDVPRGTFDPVRPVDP